MDNKRFSKNSYVEDRIISPLNKWNDGNASPDNIEWWRLLNEVHICQEMNIMDELHKQIIPFYQKYLYADNFVGKDGSSLFLNFINEVAKSDKQFIPWAETIDLITIAECWSDSLLRIDGSISYFISIMQLLLNQGYSTDWQSLSEQLKQELHQTEVYSDYKTGELMCFLHGVAMLMNTSWSNDKKMEYFELLKERDLNKNTVIKEYLTTAADDKNYDVIFYSLE